MFKAARTALIASNGIEIAFDGATGTVKNNFVIDNVYTAADGNPGNGASGILLYDTLELGNILVSGNMVGNAQEGIAIVRDTYEHWRWRHRYRQ